MSRIIPQQADGAVLLSDVALNTVFSITICNTASNATSFDLNDCAATGDKDASNLVLSLMIPGATTIQFTYQGLLFGTGIVGTFVWGDAAAIAHIEVG
tara:strand:- start:179 stop:472 length:294 start_codon:yes stop_codon:yes gene_type:complete